MTDPDVSTIAGRLSSLENELALVRAAVRTLANETKALHERLRLVHAIDESQNAAITTVTTSLSRKDKGWVLAFVAIVQVAAELLRPALTRPEPPPPALEAAPSAPAGAPSR